MALTNKLNITDSTALARTEEKLSKQKALLLFESGYLNTLRAGTFNSLARIHRYLFEEIYDFAGEIRTVNLSKGIFRNSSSRPARSPRRPCKTWWLWASAPIAKRFSWGGCSNSSDKSELLQLSFCPCYLSAGRP